MQVAGEMLKIAGRCDILVNNAGKYKPMTFDHGHNQGQGPLDGGAHVQCMSVRLMHPSEK